ncbi:MAG: mandelate racemase/muconate lactonizing enzyme family protein [Clostridiales bacterium]|nr:mandelate racemase/muconate lactonizing enzyme family protein [Clostridiales bacterium]
MKITAIKGIPLRCSCSPISDALSTSTARQALLVKIETDTELYGIGEAFTFGAPLVVMKYLVENQLGPMLVGEDPTNIEKCWNTLYIRTLAHGRRSMTMGAISGIDIALWDLFGKAVHLPVSRILGAVYDRIPAYASGGFYAPGKDLDGLREELENYKKQGYRDTKIKIGRNLDRIGLPLSYMGNQDCAVRVEDDYRRVELAKSIVGEGRLIVDTNASWDSFTALSRGRELSRLGVDWLEEPIPFEDLEGLQRISRELPELQIIGCETQQGSRNFETMIKMDTLDIVQPDIGWAGGFTECRKIGVLAEASGRKISLHCFGSAVLFAASLQLAASMANTEMLESEENPNPLKSDISVKPFEADEKMNFYVPDGDGLGIELDWEKMEKYTVSL